MKILISIPVYINNDLHLDFTKQTINSIRAKHAIIYNLIINNFCAYGYENKLYELEKRKYARIINNPKGNSVSAAWNLGIKKGIEEKMDYILTCNNDIVFHPKCIDNLIKFAKEHREFILWTASEYSSLRTLNQAAIRNVYDEHPHFSCFMISPETIKLLKEKEKYVKEPYPGYFDENFKVAYFEDQDFTHRIYRAGYRAAKTASALFYHYGSRTIKTDDDLYIQNTLTYELSRNYFKKKWGYDPHNYCPKREEERLKLGYKMPFGYRATI